MALDALIAAERVIFIGFVTLSRACVVGSTTVRQYLPTPLPSIIGADIPVIPLVAPPWDTAYPCILTVSNIERNSLSSHCAFFAAMLRMSDTSFSGVLAKRTIDAPPSPISAYSPGLCIFSNGLWEFSIARQIRLEF